MDTGTVAVPIEVAVSHVVGSHDLALERDNSDCHGVF